VFGIFWPARHVLLALHHALWPECVLCHLLAISRGKPCSPGTGLVIEAPVAVEISSFLFIVTDWL